MLIVPLILAIIADGTKSVFLMLRSIVPYYMLLPMVVGFFSAYSFSRCWDLTWGNRPTEADPSHQHNAKQKVEELKTQSATLTAFVALANVFFFFLSELILQYNSGKLYIALVIFSTAIIQMAIGLVWFSWWRITYFFKSLAFFITHCRGMKRFTYKDYGHEEEDAVDVADIYTLVDDNSDDVANINDFIDDGDAVEDYYDADAQAIVLVDGPVNRHMSVSHMNIYATQPAKGGLESVPEEVEGASAPSSPHKAPVLHSSSFRGDVSSSNLQASLTRSAIRSPKLSSSNLSNGFNTLTRHARTALANSIIDPNRVPIIASPGTRAPNLRSSSSLHNSGGINAQGLRHRNSIGSPALRNPAILRDSAGGDDQATPANAPATLTTSNTSNVSFANPVVSNNQPKHQ